MRIDTCGSMERVERIRLGTAVRLPGRRCAETAAVVWVRHAQGWVQLTLADGTYLIRPRGFQMGIRIWWAVPQTDLFANFK